MSGIVDSTDRPRPPHLGLVLSVQRDRIDPNDPLRSELNRPHGVYIDPTTTGSSG